MRFIASMDGVCCMGVCVCVDRFRERDTELLRLNGFTLEIHKPRGLTQNGSVCGVKRGEREKGPETSQLSCVVYFFSSLSVSFLSGH